MKKETKKVAAKRIAKTESNYGKLLAANKAYNRRVKGELRPVTKWSAFVVMQCATRVWAALELQARKAARLAAKQQKDSAK